MALPQTRDPILAPDEFEDVDEGMGMGMGIGMETREKKTSWRARWEESKGMALILMSEFFGTCMAAAARALETGDGGMTTLQILFVRFAITFVLSSLYMWYTSVPDFPFGKPEVRKLLVLRGFGGFIGVFGFYYSLQYLPVAEAILLGFTTPIFTAYACSIFLRAPFDKKQLVAGLVSFLGVILIAQPFPFFRSPGGDDSIPKTYSNVEAAPSQRLSAVLVGLLGVLGATCAYTTIRVIGTRAHPLLSVNYYGLMATLFSGLILFLPIFPSVVFRLPSGFREWALLVGIGVSGFLLQFMMTAGLVRDKSSKATNMMYSNVLYGLFLDYMIWGAVPGWASWMGGSVVVAATLWGVMQKSEAAVEKSDEEYAMVGDDDILEDASEGEDENNGIDLAEEADDEDTEVKSTSKL